MIIIAVAVVVDIAILCCDHYASLSPLRHYHHSASLWNLTVSPCVSSRGSEPRSLLLLSFFSATLIIFIIILADYASAPQMRRDVLVVFSGERPTVSAREMSTLVKKQQQQKCTGTE